MKTIGGRIPWSNTVHLLASQPTLSFSSQQLPRPEKSIWDATRLPCLSTPSGHLPRSLTTRRSSNMTILCQQSRTESDYIQLHPDIADLAIATLFTHFQVVHGFWLSILIIPCYNGYDLLQNIQSNNARIAGFLSGVDLFLFWSSILLRKPNTT